VNIRDLIRSVDGGGDPDEIAAVVLHKVLDDLSPDEQLAVLTPLVRSEVVRLRRHRVRQLEDTAFAGAKNDLDALCELQHRPFLDVISHRMITWGEATRKQHLARARWLRNSQIRPKMQTVARHETAARMISERHVQCLAELPEFAQAA
jgi:hypothetical protein